MQYDNYIEGMEGQYLWLVYYHEDDTGVFEPVGIYLTEEDALVALEGFRHNQDNDNYHYLFFSVAAVEYGRSPTNLNWL